MVTYEFPFCFPAKERERAKAVKRGAKWVGTVYSPQSTKKAYEKIRKHIFKEYPDYEKNKVTFLCKCTVLFGITEKNNIADLDNHLKMLDALSKDGSRKENSGFKGIWTDDNLIKEFSTKFVYVDSEDKEFTYILLEEFHDE